MVVFHRSYFYLQRPPKSDTPAKLQKRASDKDVGDSKSGLCYGVFNVLELAVHSSIDQILLTSTYDPKKMSDFDPELDLRGTRLIQQPLYDQDSNLVPPWQAPFVFRKGALLLVEATLSVFHFVVGPQPSHVCSSLRTFISLSKLLSALSTQCLQGEALGANSIGIPAATDCLFLFSKKAARISQCDVRQNAQGRRRSHKLKYECECVIPRSLKTEPTWYGLAILYLYITLVSDMFLVIATSMYRVISKICAIKAYLLQSYSGVPGSAARRPYQLVLDKDITRTMVTNDNKNYVPTADPSQTCHFASSPSQRRGSIIDRIGQRPP